MTDKTNDQIAEALREAGILTAYDNEYGRWYGIPGAHEMISNAPGVGATKAVRDPRTAMACLKAWPKESGLHWRITKRIDPNDASKGLVCQDPRAICLAYVEARE
jgi:hypothetical protein